MYKWCPAYKLTRTTTIRIYSVQVDSFFNSDAKILHEMQNNDKTGYAFVVDNFELHLWIDLVFKNSCYFHFQSDSA